MPSESEEVEIVLEPEVFNRLLGEVRSGETFSQTISRFLPQPKVEPPQLYCVHCWNPVELIKYREGRDSFQIYGGIGNKYKHSSRANDVRCSINPITDEDVTSENPA